MEQRAVTGPTVTLPAEPDHIVCSYDVPTHSEYSRWTNIYRDRWNVEHEAYSKSELLKVREQEALEKPDSEQSTKEDGANLWVQGGHKRLSDSESCNSMDHNSDDAMRGQTREQISCQPEGASRRRSISPKSKKDKRARQSDRRTKT